MKYKRSIFNFQLSTLNFQLSTFLVAVLFAAPLQAQVTIGNNTDPKSFSLLEMDVTYHKGGLRLPQLTTQQRNDLSLSSSDLTANGLVIYNTETQCIEFWHEGTWVSMCNGSSAITLEDRGRGIADLDVTLPFVAAGSSLTLTPHDSPECNAATPPYTADILFGGEYAKAVTINSSTGEFTLTMSGNQSGDVRMAILRVTDKCSGKYSDYLLIQDGCSLPAKPDAISGQKFASTDGVGVTYSIADVAGATSYTWNLPVGWEGSSDSTRLITKPGAKAENGIISVTANNACGSSEACVFAVNVVHGCGAQISDTEWREFLCYNLGVVDKTANPFEPSKNLNGDYYFWGQKTPARTVDTYLGGGYNSSNFYGSGNAGEITTIKSATDPCPSGFRVPSDDEWTGVLTYNSKIFKGPWLPSSNPYGDPDVYAGVLFGDALFLPAAGWYGHGTFELAARGSLAICYTTMYVAGSSGDIIVSLSEASTRVGSAGSLTAVTIPIRCISMDCTLGHPDAIEGTAVITNGGNYTYRINPVEGANNYTWTVPANWSIAGAAGNSLTTTATSITVTPHTDLNTDGAITVTANNDCGSSEESVMGVSLCGANVYISGSAGPTEMRAFMCHNLGVAGNPDPFTASKALNGDYYQWGYKYPSATVDVVLGTPTTAGGSDRGAWNSSDQTPGVYGDGIALSSAGGGITKSSTDPCPKAFRVPNYNEWVGVYKENARVNKGDWLYKADDPNLFVGAMFGDLLFLPAAGDIFVNDGLLRDRGSNCEYWGALLWNTSQSSAFYVTLVPLPTPILVLVRGNGCSIRCIAE